MKKGEGITVNAGNIHSIFEQVSKMADRVAHAAGVIIDVEILWMISPEHDAAWKEAHRLNLRDRRLLSLSDKRTRGGRYLEQKRREFREEMLTRYRSSIV